MTKAKMTFAFRQDADGYTEVIELCADGSSILWDVRFPTKDDATAAIETYKRRLKCRKTWGLGA